jgi:hypothetical protein
MTCITPELQLPPSDEFGNYSIRFRVGFELDGYSEYRELDEEKHNISLRLAVFKLPSVDEHHWLPYDSNRGEPLTLKVGLNFPQLPRNMLVVNGMAPCRFLGAISNMKLISWLEMLRLKSPDDTRIKSSFSRLMRMS